MARTGSSGSTPNSPRPRTPTLIALHHPKVRRIVAGHLHRTNVADLPGCAVLTAPSMTLQACLNLSADDLQLTDESRKLALRMLLDGHLSSHVEPVEN